jgi:Mn-dependent DtxR family transcriptional regulator
MEITDLEMELLNLLADEWDKSGPPGYLETKILAQRLDVSVWKTKSAIKSLFVKGLVDSDELETYAAYLTPEGYQTARG